MMLTSLDLLILVFLGLLALMLLAGVLMFLLKNRWAKRGCFWFLAIEGMALGLLNHLMTPGSYGNERLQGWLLAGVALAAVILDWKGKSPKAEKIARILVVISVVGGMLSAAY